MSDSTLIDWLLDARTPSIRYLTLTRLLGSPEAGPDALAARQAMGATGPIPAILARQGENGAWMGEKAITPPNTPAPTWSMLLLAELEADPMDLQVRKGAAHMLEVTDPELEQRLKKGGHGWTCLWATILPINPDDDTARSACCKDFSCVPTISHRAVDENLASLRPKPGKGLQRHDR